MEVELLESPAEAEEAPEQEAPAEDAGQPEDELLTAPEAEIPAPEAAVDTDAQFEDWVSKVNENPKSITSVPTKEHARVHEAILERTHSAYQSEVQRVAREAQEMGRSQAIAEFWVQGKDALLDEDNPAYDPGAFATWRKQAPDEYGTYTALKARMAPITPVQSLDMQINGIWQELGQHPAAFEAVKAQMQRQGIPKTPQGVAQLQRLAYEQIGAAKSRPGPAKAALAARADAATSRSQLAKAPGTGSPVGSKNVDLQTVYRTQGTEAWAKAYEAKHGFAPP